MKKKKNSTLAQINNEDFNYSHIGEASTKKFLYLLDKKKNIFENKKQKKIEPQDYFHEKEKLEYDDIYEKDEYEDDIFNKEYDLKYKKELQEKKLKFNSSKNSCAFITKILNEKNKKENEEEKKKADIEREINFELENEKYKYHLIHHHHDLLISKSLIDLYDQVSSNSYKPKLEFIFKKIIYSPEFNKMSGRYDQENKRGKIEQQKNISHQIQKQKEHANYQKKLKIIRNIHLKNQKESRNINKKLGRNYSELDINLSINKKNSIISIKNNIEESHNNISKYIDENTVSTINYNNNNNKTTSGKKRHNSNLATEIIYPNISKNDSAIFINNNTNRKSLKRVYSYNTLNNINQNYSNYSYKKYKNNNSSSSTSKKKYINNNKNLNKVVNFDKMLPREYINKLKQQRTNIYSSLSPNYDIIRPKCIMKVIYGQKHYKKNKPKEFKSDYNQIIFDINKSYNKYNNHFPPKNIYLGKMTGRKMDKTLPSYMLDQYNRNSYNTFNEKSLKMNNFANGDLLQQRSSFNEKKTFNYKLNDQYTGNEDNYLTKDINIIFRRITKYPINNQKSSYGEYKSLSDNYNNKTKMPEYYQMNLDRYGKYPFSCGEKIDGFTMKTIKGNKSTIDMLSDYEKHIFLSKLD